MDKDLKILVGIFKEALKLFALKQRFEINKWFQEENSADRDMTKGVRRDVLAVEKELQEIGKEK